MIECVDVVKEFQNGDSIQRVLKGINLTINPGDLITIMGRSGSGKTTFLNCISLLSDLTDGHILIDGKEVNGKSRREKESIRQENIGLVFQNSNLITCLTPLDNLIIATHDKISYAQKKSIALNLLEKVGLKNKYNQKTSSLSGGEMQRVAIVRALINSPKIVLCDEPTGALDQATSKEVMDFLLNICKTFNSALVIVTHDESIGLLGKRRFMMKEGLLSEI